MSTDPRANALRALARFVVADSRIGDTLLRVSEITTEAMPSAELAGISLLSDAGKPTTAIFTDTSAPEIDAGQYESGRGPCLDAWRTQKVVRIDDMDLASDDYPEFVKAAEAHGVKSTLSLPLVVGERGIGALNLYARVADGFSKDDESLGVDLAAAAAIVLANASDYWQASELSEQLTQAMQSRAVIEQAKGMLMAQSPNLDADGAFDLLRRASQRENVKLRDIAQRIVERKALSSGDA
ncbi:MAG TPA: GAF and ANTAR domain-containing protein [Acidimicrobiales bacterium]|nr:GAF and ANTAR domain-containing protein [Acidimicrobiales bacterium]